MYTKNLITCLHIYDKLSSNKIYVYVRLYFTSGNITDWQK